MPLSKSLLAVAAVMLLAVGGVAATGVAQTGTDASGTSVSELEMDATLDNETVTVTVADDGTAVENASITVEAEEEVAATTDGNGVVTVNRSALTEDGEPLEGLEVSYESEHAEGTLEYVVRNGSLTLVEESYEYEVAEEESDEEESEDEESETSEDEREDEEESEEETEDDESDE